MKRCFLIVLLAFIKVFCYAYLPIVDHYPFEKNGSGPENWDICEVENYQLAFANQEGLLTFDGTEWNSINNGPRAIKSLFYDAITKRTYAGSKGDFGYFIREEGSLQYYSLQKKLEIQQEKVVWKILKFKDNIFFQSEDNLFIFDGENIKVLPIHGFLRSLFPVNEKLFLVDTQKGLLEYKNGNLHTLPESEFFKNDEVNMILPFSNGDLLIFSWRRKKLYRYNFRDVLPWKNGLTEVAKDYPFCGIMYENKFVIGTTENGIYFIDEDGNIITHLNVKSGLIYNKVFNLYKDNSRNIWVCYEYGLDKLSYQLPIRLINKHINVPGSAYGATKIGEEIFFLTSTGIYSSPYSCLKSFNGQKDDFTLWKGEKGPSYWIKKVDERYFFGNLFGLHYYEAGKKKTIYLNPLCKLFKEVQNEKNLFLVSFENSTSVYDNLTETILHTTKELKNLKQVEYFNGKYWSLNEEDHLHSFTIKKNESVEIEDLDHYPDFNEIKGRKSLLIYHENLLLITQDKIFNLSDDFKESDSFYGELKSNKDSFEEFNNLTYQRKAFREEIIHWLNSKNISNTARNFYSNYLNSIPENHINFVSFLTEETVCLGGYSGFKIIDLSADVKGVTKPEIILKNLSAFQNADRSLEMFLKKEDFWVKQGKFNKNSIPYKYNNIALQVSNTSFIMSNLNSYRFELLGSESKVISVNQGASATFYNLVPDTYVLKVTSKDAFGKKISKTIIEFTILSPWYMAKWFYVLVIILVFSIVVLAIYLQRKWHLSRENYLAREVETKTTELRFRNESLTSSIRYAKLIKDAHLPPQTKLSKYFRDYFILTSPKDIVGGDFCWFETSNDTLVLFVADCTGHGVPGGFMSILSINKLKNIIKSTSGDLVPSEILEDLNKEINSALNKINEEPGMLTDGLDIGCITYHVPTGKVTFAGAHRGILIYSKGSLNEIKGVRRSIGDFNHRNKQFENHEFSVQNGDILYMYSDGIIDQFGGEEDKKFSKKRLNNLIDEIVHLPMKEQSTEIANSVSTWQGLQIQTDDMIIIGLKI